MSLGMTPVGGKARQTISYIMLVERNVYIYTGCNFLPLGLLTLAL